MSDDLSAEEVDRILQSADLTDINICMRSQGERNPLHHHLYLYKGKWIVRIMRGKRRIINQSYADIEDAIAARNYALANAPPRKQAGRPRGSRNRPRGPL